ncbi:S24 family peptidase [Burkholderia vietnamiensis]|uniref:XRE family transcriptional regulator n=1 Tax=Burkholderia vietnamiensis TaxID=60552 RepID=UPI001BA5CC34
MSQETLARAVGVSQGLIAQIESGKNQGTKHIAALARALDVSVDWLETGFGERARRGGHGGEHSGARHPSPLQYPVSLKNFRMVFVIGRAQGGLPERIWTDGDYPVGAADEYAEIATTDSHAFIVPVVGDSMSPKYEPGEFALVEPSTMPDVGEDVLVRLADGRTMLKRLYRRVGELIVLKSLNPFKPEELSFAPAEVSWMYYVAHPVPARKIKIRM